MVRIVAWDRLYFKTRNDDNYCLAKGIQFLSYRNRTMTTIGSGSEIYKRFLDVYKRQQLVLVTIQITIKQIKNIFLK